MTRFLKSEAGAIILWLAASLLLAALLTPLLYNSGKTLAHDASLRDFPAPVEWLAAGAGRAKLDRYFSRALLLSALALLPALIRRIRVIPHNSAAHPLALRSLPLPSRARLLLGGILIGASCLGLLALTLELTGASLPRENSLTFGKIASKALLPALGAGIIEELIFRGLLLGLWLRACSLPAALIGSSLLFSFVHFLKPPSGTTIADPRAWHSGFEILSSTIGHFSNPAFFVTEFATLALLGLILAWSRIRTRSLWLPIGIHTGLVFSLKLFSITRHINHQSPLHPWLIGGDLKSGLLPILALLLCFLLTALLIRNFPRSFP